jgi:hypothetical protein
LAFQCLLFSKKIPLATNSISTRIGNSNQ